MRFFTLPPIGVYWPYVLINANKPEKGLRYLKRWGRVEAVIVDSGVSIFRDPSVKDYPPSHLERIAALYRMASLWAGEVYAVAPDYPDDYHPRSLWVGGRTNIERTVDSVIAAVDEHPGIRWLIPLQGHYGDPWSVTRCADLYRETGIADRFDYFGVASLCTSRSVREVAYAVRVAASVLPGKRLHAFGITLKALNAVGSLLHSFDSLAYTFPRAPGAGTSRTEAERERLFLEFVSKLPRNA
jgi:hypothetical protein